MAEMDEDIEPLELFPCGVCGRTFLPEPLRKHERICEKTSKKRKPFNSLAQRVSGTDLADFHMKTYLKPNGKHQQSPYVCAGGRGGSSPGGAVERTTSREKSPVKARHHREIEHGSKVADHEDVRASSSTTHLEAVVQKKSTSSLRTAATPIGERCPHCDRTFGHRAFERHVEWCKEHRSRVQTSPASVKIAKERLEARTKYRAPAMKSQRAFVREKYSSHRADRSRRSPSQNRRDSSADEEESTPIGKGLSRTGSLRQNSVRRDDEKTMPVRRSASMRREPRKVSEGVKCGEGDAASRTSNIKRTPSVRRTSKPTGYLSRQSSQDEGVSRRNSKKDETTVEGGPLTPMRATRIESVCPNMSSPVISDQTYDPFVLAERQLQELLSDNQTPFVVTKTPSQYTPRPNTAPCRSSVHENSFSKRTSGSNLTLPNIYEPKSAFVPIIKQHLSDEQRPDKTHNNNKTRKDSAERDSKRKASSDSTRSSDKRDVRNPLVAETRRTDSNKTGEHFEKNENDRNVRAVVEDGLTSSDSFKTSSDNKNSESDERTNGLHKNRRLENENNARNNNNNKDDDKKATRGSIIEPPNDFQDEMKLFRDNFELIENLVNENYNAADSSEKGADNRLDIFNGDDDDRKFSDNVERDEPDNSKSDLDSFEKENVEKEDAFGEPKSERKTTFGNKAKYNLDSKSMLSLNSILNDSYRSDDLYNSQIDPCLINSVDNLSIPDDLRRDESDHYSVQYDKQIATLEPLVLTKTEMNAKRLHYDSDSINEDFDIDGFIRVLDDDDDDDDDTFPTVNKTFHKNRSYPSVISDNNSLRQSSVSLNSSIIGRQKSPESLKGSSSMTYLKKSVSSFLDPVSKPRSLRNKGDVERYFGDKVDKKKSEEKKSVPEELFSVDDEMYEEYKKYEQMYLQEKMLAEANKKSKRSGVVYGDESSPDDLSSPERQRNNNESRMDNFGKPSGDSAYSSLNRSSPKPYSTRTHHRIRNDRLHVEQQQRDRCPSSSGSDISLPPVSSVFHKSSAIHKSMVNSVTPRHFDFEPVAHDDVAADKFRSIGSTETLHEDDKIVGVGSRKSSLDSNASGRLSKFCYECGSAFPVSTAKFCVNCGVARLVL